MALILTRKPGESIMIGDDIEIVVNYGKGKYRFSMSLAIHAPKHIPVHRKEIYDRIRAKGEQLISEKS